jgi:hypothetical protein
VSRRAVIVALVGAAVLAPQAVAGTAPTCANLPLPDRLELAQVAFVGSLLSSREDAGGATFWKFDVDQPVKGVTGSAIDVRADSLTDIKGNRLKPNIEVGVLAQLEGATVTMDSCGLTDPAALLSVADEARGGPIKMVIGLIVLVGVLALSYVRMRRGSRPTFPGYDPGPPK